MSLTDLKFLDITEEFAEAKAREILSRPAVRGPSKNQETRLSSQAKATPLSGGDQEAKDAAEGGQVDASQTTEDSVGIPPETSVLSPLTPVIMDGGLSTAALEWDRLSRTEKLNFSRDIIGNIDKVALEDLVLGHPFPSLKPEEVLDINIEKTITGAKLWTATLLLTEVGRFCLLWTHLKYLEAHSRLIESAGYQLSEVNTLELIREDETKAGLTEPELKEEAYSLSSQLITSSIDLMWLAIHLYRKNNKMEEKDRPLATVSLGPYGATLFNGSEYTGNYPERMQTIGSLAVFHLRRLHQYLPSFKNIDLLAFETLPLNMEGFAIMTVMELVYDKFKQLGITKDLPSYLLAYNPKVLDNEIVTVKAKTGGDLEEQLIPSLETIFTQSLLPPFSIGLNCIKPDANITKISNDLVKVLSRYNYYLREEQVFKDTKLDGFIDNRYSPYLSVYCDGGLFFDLASRSWTGRKLTPSEWANTVRKVTDYENIQKVYPNIGYILGGCCNSSFAHIDSVHSLCEQ